MKNKFRTAIFFASTLLLATPALANSDTSLELQRLKERLAILEDKMAQESDKKADDVIVTLKPAPSFKTRDGKTSFELDGRIMVDAGVITKDKTSDTKNSTSIRRLWLGAGGNIDKDWSYRALVGFENNSTSIADAFLDYHGLKNADILIGNFFENNGIDAGTANLINPLMERSSGITTFRQLRRTGVSFNPYGENWGAHFGVFGSGTNNSSSTNTKGEGVSGRAHIALINDKTNSQFLHLGFNSTYRTPDSATKTMRFKSTGDSNVINAILIDTGNITNVNSYYQNMAEFRYQQGSFNLTSEYITTNIQRSGMQNLEFTGGYVLASYFLTGEKYGYDTKMGTPTPAKIGKGAWEVASRYSMTNLNNKDVQGGKLNSYDFGVNYYPNDHLKLMANYVFNRVDNNTALQKQNPQYLMLRAQIWF